MFAFVLSLVRAGFGSKADEDLVKSALAGGAAATRVLTRRLLPVVRSRCSAYLRRRSGVRVGAQDVDDLMQEIWLSLFMDDGHLLRAYDAERGKSLEGFVGLVCRRELWRRNRAATAQRRGGGAHATNIDDVFDASSADPDPEEALVGHDLASHLEAHLDASLPERGRLVLRAIYEDGLEPQAVADVLGVNLQVVYNWQHKIRTLSRAFLSEAGAPVA